MTQLPVRELAAQSYVSLLPTDIKPSATRSIRKSETLDNGFSEFAHKSNDSSRCAKLKRFADLSPRTSVFRFPCDSLAAGEIEGVTLGKHMNRDTEKA